MRQGFEGPKCIAGGGVGRDFVRERVVILGLDVILLSVVQDGERLAGTVKLFPFHDTLNED